MVLKRAQLQKDVAEIAIVTVIATAKCVKILSDR